jgi:hypothetical protein
MGIGSVWMPAELRSNFKSSMTEIKERHSVHGEVKWQKVSPRYLELYKELVDYFFNSNYLRFRVILVESDKVDNVKFNNSDAELGFYKFYYQLLKTWIWDFNTYSVFVDLKENRNKGRLNELEHLLDMANLLSDVSRVQGLPSEQSLGIQLADVLTGLVTAKFNNKSTSESKRALIHHVEQYLGGEIAHTFKSEEKFNVFKINLTGGW